MSAIAAWNPFDRPRPTADCLMHEAVLVQAWKKSHAYIRTRNSYADVLELDLSAANLKAEIDRWKGTSKNKDLLALKPKPMRLVPAPKASFWGFSTDRDGRVRWRPRQKDPITEIPVTSFMRPLAHLSIRDQTFATAAMICLADPVESEQGDCSVETSAEARAKCVSSYGNRLFCEWATTSNGSREDGASFGWGNTHSYRKYSEDYRAFLQRPRDVCGETECSLHPGEELGVLSLDLTGFYDRIKPGDVISALQAVCKARSIQSDHAFWKCLSRIMAWSWAKDSTPARKLLRDGKRPVGLPQGLVASGFFSNAYMLAFDAAARRAITTIPEGSDVVILDYCRYVDDIRLVVQWQKSKLTEAQLADYCTSWLKGLLRRHANGQDCNIAKTEYVPYRDLRSKSGRAATMDLVQRQMSGPVDMEAIEESSVALEGLLRSLEFDFATDQKEVPPEAPGLAGIFRTKSEVRDDTLKRFATNRQFKLLRERRLCFSNDESKEGQAERQRVDADIETAARRMIWFWCQDPSLGIVLRHALNLLPTPDLLEPVLVVLNEWIHSPRGADEDLVPQWVCWYAAADLLKAGATETGISAPEGCLPEKSDLPGYREVLANFAEELLALSESAKPPWFVQQQAVMYLVSVGRHVAVSRRLQNPILADYLALVHTVEGRLHKVANPAQRLPSLLLVAHQFDPVGDRIVSRLSRWLRTQEADIAAEVVEAIYLADTSIFDALIVHTEDKKEHAEWRARIHRSFVYLPTTRPRSIWSFRRKTLSLGALASTIDNPFRQENAALRLLLALVDFVSEKSLLSPEKLAPHAIVVRCSDWQRVASPCLEPKESQLGLHLRKQAVGDPRYALPSWCSQERRPFMIVGRLLRAAVMGDADYTAPGQYSRVQHEGYSGIWSSWYKRQHGMFHRPDALGGPQTACSPWLAELLSKLLQWPGCREAEWLIPSWASVRTLRDLRILVEKRLTFQASIYAKAAELSVYIHPVRMKLKCPPILTTVLIQTVRPWRADFDTHGTTLDAVAFRPVRREHLASLLRIAEKLLNLRRTYGKESKADLLILPEFCVHHRDLDLVERLVDRTRAMALCGLVFRSVPGCDGLVNTARWIIPDYKPTGRSLIHIDQGKRYPTKLELDRGVSSWCPCQWIIEIDDGLNGKPYRLACSVCYDATDLRLASDLKNLTDMVIVPSNNKDVDTFDTMSTALSFHMYQHVVVVNTGEYGGTAVMAPYAERFERVLTHHHGGGHASVSVVDIDLSDYRISSHKKSRQMKTPPADYRRHECDAPK